jgi:hypothetical protein
MMIDTYGIAKNLALTGALGYPKLTEVGSIFNKDVSAMLKLISPLSAGMDEMIRADRDRFAAMKAVGGVTGCGRLAHIPSVLDTLPKDLSPSIATNYLGMSLIKELRDVCCDRQHDWYVVPPPPEPIRLEVTINLKSRPPGTGEG